MASLDAVLAPYRDAGGKPKRIAELQRRILESCTPKQVPFVLDPHRKLALLTPRRSGKTSAVLRRFAAGALAKKNGRYLYAALSRPTAEDILWDPLKEFMAAYEIPVSFSESDLTVRFLDTGSEIQLVGADDKKQVDKKRGQQYDGAAVDEAASFPGRLLKYFLQQVLKWALMDRRGWLAMVGTPGNTLAGPFFEATREGADGTRPWHLRGTEEWSSIICTCALGSNEPCTAFNWSQHGWSLEDNVAMPHLWLEALAEKAQERWSDENPIWQREALGRWVSDDTGRVYRYRKYITETYTDEHGVEATRSKPWNTWEPIEKTKENPFGLPLGHSWRFSLGGDLGSKKVADEQKEREAGKPRGGARMDTLERNKTILELWAYSDTCPDLYHALESSKAMHISALAEEIKRIEGLCRAYGGVTLDGIFLDVGYRSGGGMIVDELSAVHGVPAQAADKARKPDAIELLNSDLVDGRAKIIPGSHLETEMLTLQWDELQPDKENKSQANDACDAAIYGRRGALHQYGHETGPSPAAAAPTPTAPAGSEGDRRQNRNHKAWFGDDEDSGGTADEWGNSNYLKV